MEKKTTKNEETKIKENKNDFLIELTWKQKEDNTVIVIHYINYATTSVIDKIKENLDIQEENIFLPNVWNIEKKIKSKNYMYKYLSFSFIIFLIIIINFNINMIEYTITIWFTL